MPNQHLASLTRKSLERGKALITIIIILIALPGFLLSFTGRVPVAQRGPGEKDWMVGCLSSLPHGVQHLWGWQFAQLTGRGNRRIHSLDLSDPSGTLPEKKLKPQADSHTPAPLGILQDDIS